MSVLVRHVWHTLKNNNTIHNYTPILQFSKLLHFPCPHITGTSSNECVTQRLTDWSPWFGQPETMRYLFVGWWIDGPLPFGGKGVSSMSQVPYPALKERFEKKTAPSFYHDCQSCRKQDAFDVWMTAMYEISNYCCRVCECVSVISQYWSGKWFEVARQNSETTQKYLQ